MCVVSMIYDHYFEKWDKKPREQPGSLPPYILPNMPSQKEIQEFYDLLKKAKEYDKKNNQPDCELEEKKQKLLKLAEELGIKINFE